MGAGVSIAKNVSDAVASATTEVLNQTNTSFDQNVGQTEIVGLNNCDMYVGKNLNISMSQALTAALNITANVQDTTNISNSIAQALTQAAKSSVGEMAIGYASASNVASTYASMNTNIANNVTQSAIQTTSNEQSFQCNNSTITVNGDMNLSELQTSNTSGDMNTDVTDSTAVQNAIKQTISQTATASTGMDMWSFLILGIAVIVGVVIFKILATRSRNQALGDSDVQNCVMELSKKSLQGGGGSPRGFAAAQASCPSCVDKCIPVSHSSHLFIHKGIFIAWIVILGLLGATLGIWYGEVAKKGCINNDSCGSHAASSWASGCSCDMENVMTNATATCKSPVTETITGLGVPVKYQYPLLHAMTSGATTTSSSVVGAASLQGMVVASLKMGQTEYNSNNGNNLFTLLTYENLWTNGPPIIQPMFVAAATYIGNNPSKFANLPRAMNSETDLHKKAHLLFRYLNPLRLVYADTADTYLEVSSQSSNEFAAPNATVQANATGSKVYPVPAPFRYNRADQAGSAGAGTFGKCSITTLTYSDLTGAVPFSNEYNDSGVSGDTDTFCADNSTMRYPGTDSSFVLTFKRAQSTETPFTVEQLLSDLNGQFNNAAQTYAFSDADSTVYTPLDVYCRWADLTSINGDDYGMMRLLYSGILSTQANMGSSGSMWGVNALLRTDTITATHDYAYSAGYVWSAATYSDDCSTVRSVGSCSGLGGDTPPTSVIRITAEDGISEGQYNSGTGMAMAGLHATSALSGQGYTATSAGMGYCRDAFLNESTLIALWVAFVFWALAFPAYIGIRAYIGESQSTADDRRAEMRDGVARGFRSDASTSSSSSSSSNKSATQYYLNPNQSNPFKNCSTSGPGTPYATKAACKARIPQ